MSQVKSRSNDFSVKLNVNRNRVFVFKDNLIILSSALDRVEIPDKDLNLFRNHYHVPVGIIDKTKVKVKDIAKGGLQPELAYDNIYETVNLNIHKYKFLRNALVSSLITSIPTEEKFVVFKELIKFIEEDSIVYDTLEPSLQLGDFEKIEISGNYSVGLERLIGILKNIKDAVVKTNLGLDKASLGQWIKKIVSARPTDNKSFFNTLIICNPNYPKDWDGYKSFFFSLLFFAFARDEVADNNKGFPTEFIEKLELNEFEIKFWNAFFKGLFSEKVTNIYLSASLRHLQFYCELLAFHKTVTLHVRHNEMPHLENILSLKLPLKYNNPSPEEKQIIANEYSDLVEEKRKKNASIVSDLNELLINIPTSDKKTIKSNRLILFAFTKDFKITSEVKKFWILSSNNSKTKTFVIINQIDKTKEDIFSLEFDRLLKDFKETISQFINANIEVLTVKPEEKNFNDLLRNLKKIYAENKLKSIKDIFLLNNFENAKISQKIIDAIPNTIFWDSGMPYYYVIT